MPGRTVLIQGRPEVIITTRRERTRIMIPDQTTTGQITIPATHQEVIQGEVIATVHTAPALPPVQVAAAAVTADVLKGQIPDIENKLYNEPNIGYEDFIYTINNALLHTFCLGTKRGRCT